MGFAARCTRLRSSARFPAPSGDMPAVPWPLFKGRYELLVSITLMAGSTREQQILWFDDGKDWI